MLVRTEASPSLWDFLTGILVRSALLQRAVLLFAGSSRDFTSRHSFVSLQRPRGHWAAGRGQLMRVLGCSLPPFPGEGLTRCPWAGKDPAPCPLELWMAGALVSPGCSGGVWAEPRHSTSMACSSCWGTVNWPAKISRKMGRSFG